ncbi:MAG TPA: Gfo/Idh/MocA family oxidoreductase [Streptosporangiaceae bacterium]|nr:Gfo/Idh/MocA family oxidoreductase [Streptosporangiaceae bacterium]
MSGGGPGRIRVGVVGAGVIAQVMYLHYLGELAGLYDVRAICDIVPGNASACAERYAIPVACTDWRDLLAADLDALLVLTSGSHAPMAIAAAEAGLHVLVEKPMCFSSAEGRAMVAAADTAGVTLMVGYPKRYDPAYLRFADIVGEDTRLLRVTTLESPFRPYLRHYRLLPPAAPAEDVLARLRTEAMAAAAAAIGPASELELRVYQGVLLDTLVHELNAVRGLLGEPDLLEYAEISEQAVTVLLRFGAVRVAIHWIDLPGIARYQMEFASYAPHSRATLTFGSPYLRDEPAILVTEGGEPGTARSWRHHEVAGYESGFRRELEAFAASISASTRPVTSGRDGLADIVLCEAIVACHRTGRPIENPAATP